MLTVNFDMCFHFVGQWMRAFIVTSIKAIHLIVTVFWCIYQCFHQIVLLITVKNMVLLTALGWHDQCWSLYNRIWQWTGDWSARVKQEHLTAVKQEPHDVCMM